MIQKRIMEPQLSEMVDGFLECALWASFYFDSGEPLDKVYSCADFSESAMNAATHDCRKFLEANEAMIDGNEFNAGHDFFLTRNGHGAGFWDGDWREHGEALTDASKAFGKFDVYPGDDGKLYVFGRE